eukprot:2726934-Pleurochrysis_carterae.AAC.1
MGPRGSQNGRPGAGRLASVAETGTGGPTAHPPSLDGITDAEAVPSTNPRNPRPFKPTRLPLRVLVRT